VRHIPFRGPAEAFTDVISGRVDFYFLPIAPAVPNIKTAQVLALAVSTPTRAALLPDVPTVVEAGIRLRNTCSGAGLRSRPAHRAPSSRDCTTKPGRP
jgi:tripartite-type tricarboxylate transporter receptor subunit TctC